MSEHHSSAAAHLRYALEPPGGPAPNPAFRNLCQQEIQASRVDTAGVNMPGVLKCHQWSGADCSGLVHKGYTPDEAQYYLNVQMARKEVLRERLAGGMRMRALLAMTAFEGCTSGEFQVAYTGDLLELGCQIAIAPDVQEVTGPVNTSVILFDESGLYTQFPPWPDGTHQDWHEKPQDEQTINEHVGAFNAAWEDRQPIEPALRHLRRYGEATAVALRAMYAAAHR